MRRPRRVFEVTGNDGERRARSGSARPILIVVQRVCELLQRGNVRLLLRWSIGAAEYPGPARDDVETARQILIGDERKRARQVLGRNIFLEALLGMLGRLRQVFDGLLRIARILEVVSDQAGEFARAVGRSRNQPMRDCAVMCALRTLQHRIVGNAMQQMMVECELACALERRVLVTGDEMPVDESRQRVGIRRIDMSNRFIPEHGAHDRRGLQT